MSEENCIIWGDSNYTWDYLTVPWSLCYVCFTWSEPREEWGLSEIVWGGPCESVPYPDEPTPPILPEIDGGYNIAIEQQQIYVPTEPTIFKVGEKKKIVLKVKINSEILKNEKLKKEFMLKVRNIRVYEDKENKVVRIEVKK